MTRLIAIAVTASHLPVAAGPDDRSRSGIASADARPCPVSGPSGFTLLNPTPRELRRPMSTDRPDTTESPYTVDAGAVQLEMSIVEYTRDGDTRSLAAAPLNLKIGLLNGADLQLVFDPYLHEDPAEGSIAEGAGDLQLRLKLNLWGQDGGDTALAFMPFLTLPTADDDLGAGEVEGGLIVPLAIALPDDWSLGLMAEIDILHDGDDDGYDLALLHTATVARPIAGPLGAFVEYAGIVSGDAGREYTAFFNTGLTYAISGDLQLDGGLNLGLAGGAPEATIFAGFSIRF